MVQSEWRSQVITDDPVKTTNARGTLTFATSGPNTRSTQLFINTRRGGNKFLDQQGFSPIGEVLDDGMDIIDQIQDEYREKPNQGKIQNKGNAYLIQEFPNLSYIVSAK
jgi:cyclophilin family peptidyl-prolyl cis-trans isomerase